MISPLSKSNVSPVKTQLLGFELNLGVFVEGGMEKKNQDSSFDFMIEALHFLREDQAAATAILNFFDRW